MTELTSDVRAAIETRIAKTVGARVDQVRAAVTLLDEDFSKFTEGTEAEPDDVNIADNQTGVIPAEYTNVPGWSGAAIYQAGQTCAIRLGLFLDGSSSQPVSLPGVLYTPVGNYAGNGTLTFRAKYDILL